MRGSLTIAWRDFKATTCTPVFFIVAGLCSLIWSFTYIRVLEEFAQASLQHSMQSRGSSGGLNLHFGVFVGHMTMVNLLMLMSVPALTMKLFAEEKKARTYDLLLTSPVTATEITIGKFLGGLGVTTCLLLISFAYPLSTLLFTPDIQWGPLLISYFGLFLVIASYVAVGVFASVLTESVVLAVVLGLVFNIGLWFVGSISQMTDGAAWRGVLEHLSLGYHLSSFIKGSLETSALVFFASVIVLYCFLTQRVIESSRWR